MLSPFHVEVADVYLTDLAWALAATQERPQPGAARVRYS
jgi:hypothetical protein